MNDNEADNGTDNAPTTGRKGYRILKHGLLAAPCSVKVAGVPAVGNYGKLDIPLTIDGQKFLYPLSLENPQHDALVQAFGDDYAAWDGCTVQVADGKMLKQVNISPVADAKGHKVK